MIESAGYGLALFAFAWITDIAWVRWTRASNRGQAAQAGAWALAIYLFGAVGTISYVSNHFYVIALGSGSALGTYFTVRRDHRREHEVRDG